MFTGLIETLGTLKQIQPLHGGRTLTIDVSGLTTPPAIGASIAVNGVCLTVTTLQGNLATFDAVTETIERSALRDLTPGCRINLESALRAGDPLDGHLVQGHVDGVGTLQKISTLPESRIYRFSLPQELAPMVATKGSIAVDGISLTVVEVGSDWFTVSLIPETLRQTTLANIGVGSRINLEVDVLARYLARQLACREASSSPLTEDRLRALGY
ncbi:MAG: riboflavin synthase [Planctomycetota bacterium]|jgi:riboflavin synthase